MTVQDEAASAATSGVVPPRRPSVPLIGRHKQRMADEREQLEETRSRLSESQGLLQQQQARLVEFSRQWTEYARQVQAREEDTLRRLQGLDLRERQAAEAQQHFVVEEASQQQLRDELSRRDRELALRHDELEQARLHLSERERTLLVAESDVRVQSSTIAEARGDLQAASDEIEAKRARLRDDERVLATSQEELERRAHELDSLAAAVAKDRAELEASRAELDAERDAVKQDAVEVARRQAELEQRASDLQGSEQALSEQRAALAQALEAQEQELTQGQLELAQGHRDVDALRAELEEQSQALAVELEQLRDWGQQLGRQAAELEGQADRLASVDLQLPPSGSVAPAADTTGSAREGALRLLQELHPTKSAGLVAAYDDAGVVALATEIREQVTAVGALLNYDGRAAVARAGRLANLPAAVALAASLLTRRKLESDLDEIDHLPWPAIDELLERGVIGAGEAVRLGAEDRDLVRARLGDDSLSDEAVERVGWESELLRRYLDAPPDDVVSNDCALLARALLAAAQGDVQQLMSLDRVRADYEPLVSWLRWAIAEDGEVVAPLGLLDDTTLWPVIGGFLEARADIDLPEGPFAAWLAVRRARRQIQVGDLRATAAGLRPALHVDSPWRGEAWLIAAYLALRGCDGDESQRCLDEAVSVDPSRYEEVEANRVAVERARGHGEWISPYVVLGLGAEESPSAAGRAWGARIRDAKLLDPAEREERNADLNWALETIEGGSAEPWFRLATDPQLPAPEGHGLLHPATQPLPRTTTLGVTDVHAAASAWLDNLIARLIAVNTPEQGMAHHA